MCISAWPIIVFQKQLKDNSRRITEVFEATGIFEGDVVGRTIFRFITEKAERDKDGRITKIIGHHEKSDEISPALFHRMLENGAPVSTLKRLFPETAKDVAKQKGGGK